MRDILRPIPDELFPLCTRQDLVALLHGEQSIRMQMQERLDRLEAEKRALEEQVLEIEGQYVRVKNKIFGKSSEKSGPDKPEEKTPKSGEPSEKKDKGKRLPSERYPNAEIIEKELKLDVLPACRSCGHEMQEAGMYEVSEYLTVTPKKYSIVRQIRHKYRCQCHGDIYTTPALPRIKSGSAYSDEMIIDVAASKYCDLVPIERYCSIAGRQGFEDLPPNSLIEATHNLAEFVSGAVEKVKEEVLALEVLQADETRHRMLEGDAKSNWFLWGFSGEKSCYFECRDTRSGDVASEILTKSKCKFLVTDVFSGYSKAVAVTNAKREERGEELIESAYCNAHSRRKFKEASEAFYNATKYYTDQYKKIYALNKELKEKSGIEGVEGRKKMRPFFEEMKARAELELNSYSSKSLMYKALNYFIRNYNGLTLFIGHPAVPIDNNAQERNLRNPVIGRKTWYGTHSRRGAETTAKLFTLVETCKVNRVNPRNYLKELVARLHAHGAPFTPREYCKDRS